jgi:hypothetical protein
MPFIMAAEATEELVLVYVGVTRKCALTRTWFAYQLICVCVCVHRDMAVDESRATHAPVAS